MTNDIRKIKKFYWILLVFTLLIFILGIFMINYSYSISEYPKYSSGYFFSVYALSEEKSIVNFSSFRINYHFDENEGTFSIMPDGNLHNLILFFPEPYDIYSIEHWKHESQSKVSFPFKYENITDKRASIIFLNNTSEEWIFVNFKMKLSPNAKFSIWKNSLWGGNSNFYFNMGDKFECIRQECFFNLVNVEIDRSSLGTQPESSSSIEFVNQTNGVPSSIRHEFDISARSREALNKKSFWISFGSSIIAGSIFAFFSILIAIYQENRGKNKK